MIAFEEYAPQKIFLVQGSQSTYETIVRDLETKVSLVHGVSVPRLTIDHARTIARFAVEGDGTERYLVVYFSVFSPDAAQVLLKSLEEPDPYTTVVFVTQYPYVVPLTIRSRVMLLSAQSTTTTAVSRSKAEVLDYIKSDLSSTSDEDAATRRAKAIALLDEFEITYRADPAKSEKIFAAKKFLFSANLPTSFVMEYIASVLL